MSELIFMRHGNHIPDSNDNELFSGLTSSGCDEMRLIGSRLVQQEMKAYTVNNDRSLGSVALALDPEITNGALAEEVSSLVGCGKIKVDNRLQYLEHENPVFQEGLEEAFFAGECLKFFVKESDRFLGVSTYSCMASNIADIITEYTDSLLCAREFFYPSFRAKMTHLKLGEKLSMHYVDYYCSEVELNPDARIQTQTVEIRGSNYRLTDEYGHLDFNDNDIIVIKEGL